MNFQTINQVAAQGILPEYRLRQMQHQGTLPGFLSGTRFYVDVGQLQETLRAACSREEKKEYLQL